MNTQSIEKTLKKIEVSKKIIDSLNEGAITVPLIQAKLDIIYVALEAAEEEILKLESLIEHLEERLC